MTGRSNRRLATTVALVVALCAALAACASFDLAQAQDSNGTDVGGAVFPWMRNLTGKKNAEKTPDAESEESPRLTEEELAAQRADEEEEAAREEEARKQREKERADRIRSQREDRDKKREQEEKERAEREKLERERKGGKTNEEDPNFVPRGGKLGKVVTEETAAAFFEAAFKEAMELPIEPIDKNSLALAPDSYDMNFFADKNEINARILTCKTDQDFDELACWFVGRAAHYYFRDVNGPNIRQLCESEAGKTYRSKTIPFMKQNQKKVLRFGKIGVGVGCVGCPLLGVALIVFLIVILTKKKKPKPRG